jgi:peptide/nickel transport system substrate-binding protein
LIAALDSFGNENFIPWNSSLGTAKMCDLVYDLLIYWDHAKHTFIPGLAESWDVSPDAMTLTYHLRKGVQWHDGWGEFTSEDVKYNFQMHASPKSIGKVSQCRRIESMDTPDPYTLIVHFKNPYPTFFADLSIGNSGVMQGFISRKYVETVGEDAAGQKPIGTGPYKLIDSKSGDYFKFEALDNHWRVVPEFKTLTMRLIAETSTLVAALKTKEIDLAELSVEQLADLKAAGIATEVSPVGGYPLLVSLGGMVIPEDKRYDAALHNKDPWADVKVRKAMSMAIDREAIAKAIYAGYAYPIGVPLESPGSDKYQYPYDPAGAKQLLKDAGYPDGFSFKAMSYVYPSAPETPRLMEALCGYWQQIGLSPKITSIDYASYVSKNKLPAKTAGEICISRLSPIADMLIQYELYFIPNCSEVRFQDEGSYAIYKESPKATIEERLALVDKLNKYFYDNPGEIPLVRSGHNFAWNSAKLLPWPHATTSAPLYLEYVRHAQPLNTFRLFSPWPDR